MEAFHNVEPGPREVCRNRTVLITGAGGSIGSELARQISAGPAARLVVLDRDENGMFELLRLFEKENPRADIVSVLGDVRDEGLVRHTFAQWQPDIVLHSAAYKQVPLMEANCCEAVLNNVTGTRILAEAAQSSGCERFVLISTDKAVQPSSVMGATKRTAELLVQECSSRPGSKTIFTAVRFVNVYGSRGSVVPVFLEQIAAGGPVTVTHEEMTRHFLSIPEAARLLLEAATLGGGLYALRMGDAVKIVDLATELIAQSRHPVGETSMDDIEIKLTGIRPGERLHERLNGDDEFLVATDLPRIFRVESASHSSGSIEGVDELESAARRRDSARVIELLRQLPIGYDPGQTVTAQTVTGKRSKDGLLQFSSGDGHD